MQHHRVAGGVNGVELQALGVIQEEDEQPTAEEQSQSQVVKALGWSPGRKLSVRVSKVSITYRWYPPVIFPPAVRTRGCRRIMKCCG
mmetsp:Transcript_40695/g.116025  ORF Transcript_40695/g.116025 Transcript_40695/m.116025 type:complete len:87 (-) Transcript_40695:1191-1451(-)